MTVTPQGTCLWWRIKKRRLQICFTTALQYSYEPFMFSFHFSTVKLGKSEVSERFPNPWHLLLWSLNPGVNVLVYFGSSSLLTMSGISSVPPPVCILAAPVGWATICYYINFGKASVASQIPQHIHNVEPTDVPVVLLVTLLWNPRGKANRIFFYVVGRVKIFFFIFIIIFLLVISTKHENSKS